MQTYDLIGTTIALALLAYWLVLRADPRIPILVALGLLLAVVSLMVLGDTQNAEQLGNILFYALVVGVAEITVESYLSMVAERKGTSRRQRPFFGEIPERLRRRG